MERFFRSLKRNGYQSEAQRSITNDITGDYIQLRPRRDNGRLAPNESEQRFWKNSKTVVSFC